MLRDREGPGKVRWHSVVLFEKCGVHFNNPPKLSLDPGQSLKNNGLHR